MSHRFYTARRRSVPARRISRGALRRVVATVVPAWAGVGGSREGARRSPRPRRLAAATAPPRDRADAARRVRRGAVGRRRAPGCCATRRRGSPGSGRSTATRSWSTRSASGSSACSGRSASPRSTRCPSGTRRFGLATYNMVQHQGPRASCSRSAATGRTSCSATRRSRATSTTSSAPWRWSSTRSARSGTFDLVRVCRRLGHRLGLASWAGAGGGVAARTSSR